MTSRTFSQVDVFAHGPLSGNPVAVVHDAEGLDDATLADLARWTNLSETTFLLPPTDAGRAQGADYRLRILTPSEELPFAGHPTLGSAHAWLEAGGVPGRPGVVVQECDLGLVEVRVEEPGPTDPAPGAGAAAGRSLAFRAPDLLRSGAPDDATLARAVAALGVEPGSVLRAEWIDNGPGWLGLHLVDAATVLGLVPDARVLGDLALGVVGQHDPVEAERIGAGWEVRAFCPGLSVAEDPVTGSLNAGFARWLGSAGVLPAAYVVRQGTVTGHDGRVRVTTDEHGSRWVGGATRTVVAGRVDL